MRHHGKTGRNPVCLMALMKGSKVKTVCAPGTQPAHKGNMSSLKKDVMNYFGAKNAPKGLLLRSLFNVRR